MCEDCEGDEREGCVKIVKGDEREGCVKIVRGRDV